jgi:alpha-tubulin suppressor-like RCC1 family protein
MWGEDITNLRLRKPKLIYTFPSKVRQVAVGKRHAIVLTEEKGLYGWGDGTYGELGT